MLSDVNDCNANVMSESYSSLGQERDSLLQRMQDLFRLVTCRLPWVAGWVSFLFAIVFPSLIDRVLSPIRIQHALTGTFLFVRGHTHTGTSTTTASASSVQIHRQSAQQHYQAGPTEKHTVLKKTPPPRINRKVV